jgi:hypothetical protein
MDAPRREPTAFEVIVKGVLPMLAYGVIILLAIPLIPILAVPCGALFIWKVVRETNRRDDPRCQKPPSDAP